LFWCLIGFILSFINHSSFVFHCCAFLEYEQIALPTKTWTSESSSIDGRKQTFQFLKGQTKQLAKAERVLLWQQGTIKASM
jgi:hypothetical protein